MVSNPTMVRAVQGSIESSIPWFLNTPVFIQLNLCSSSMILFYFAVTINLLYNQSLTHAQSNAVHQPADLGCESPLLVVRW